MSTTITPSNAYNLLGCPYNVITKSYAVKNEINQSPVIHGIKDATADNVVTLYDDVSYAFPKSISSSTNTTNETVASVSIGAGVEETSKSLSARVGIGGECGEFSATITAKYDVSVSESNSYLYCELFDAKITAYTGFTEKDVKEGEALTLDTDFERDLNDKTYLPKKLFETYGTHIIAGIQIGGIVRFSCYANKSIYSSEEQFRVDAEATYQGISKSTSVETSLQKTSKNYSANMQGDLTLRIYGGDPAIQGKVGKDSDAFAAWLASVSYYPEFADFSGVNSLIPVWNFCDDEVRATELENCFKNYYATLLVVDTAREKLTDSNAAKLDVDASKALTKYHEQYATSYIWQAEHNYQIMTGFGAGINNDGHIDKMLIAYLDLSTGKTHYDGQGWASNDPAKTSNYEKWYEVPPGCAMTGISLRESGNNLSNMEVIYQNILEAGNQCKTDDAERTYLECYTTAVYRGDKISGYEVSYRPASYGNGYVITGIMVNATKGSGGFAQLALKIAPLKPIY